MELENLNAVISIVELIKTNNRIIYNKDYDFYINVDMIKGFTPEGVRIPDDRKDVIVRIFEKENELLKDELIKLGVRP